MTEAANVTSLVADVLDELGVDYERAASGALKVVKGTTAVYLTGDDGRHGRSVLLLAPVLTDVDPAPDKLADLLALNSTLPLGKFGWHADDRAISVEYELLAETLDAAELERAIDAVGGIADIYDERLKAVIGGRMPHVE